MLGFSYLLGNIPLWVGLLVPKIVHTVVEHILSVWEISSPYVLQVLLGIIALFTLLKDWNDYGNISKRWGRSIPLVMAVLTVIITVLSIRDTYDSNTNQINSRATISQLSTQIDQLRGDNQKAADAFRDSFTKLYDRFSDLQTRVQNADLLKEIKDTKKELLDTQSKLTPPNITPIASFPADDPAQIPITQISAIRSDNVVEVAFMVYNPSAVNARSGAVILRICEACKYAEEPKGFVAIAGGPESDRERDFQHIWAKTAMEVLSARITIPPGLPSFTLGIFVSCENCSPAEQQHLQVALR